MKYFLFFFLTPLLLTYSQTDSLFLDDFKSFITIGITGIATLADKDIKNFSQRNVSNFSNGIFSIDKYYSVEFVGASIITFYGYGLVADNSTVRKLAVKLTEATFLAGSITLITKALVGRGRPYKQEGQYYTNPLTVDNDYNSFSSAHTTLAFAYSTVMANEVDNVFWKISWYSLAGLVGYVRIYHNQHWFSDILMGAAIGYFSGEFVNNHDSNNKEKTNINLFPIPGGLTFQLRF